MIKPLKIFEEKIEIIENYRNINEAECFTSYPLDTDEYKICKEIIELIENIEPDYEGLNEMKYRLYRMEKGSKKFFACFNEILKTKKPTTQMIMELSLQYPVEENYKYIEESILLCFNNITSEEFNKLHVYEFAAISERMDNYRMLEKVYEVVEKYDMSYMVQPSDFNKVLGMQNAWNKKYKTALEYFSKAIKLFDDTRFSFNCNILPVSLKDHYYEDYSYYNRTSFENLVQGIHYYKVFMGLVESVDKTAIEVYKQINSSKLYRGLCYYFLGRYDEAYQDLDFGKERLTGKYEIDFTLRFNNAFFNPENIEKIKSKYMDISAIYSHLN